jgi:hypothetical protein
MCEKFHDVLFSYIHTLQQVGQQNLREYYGFGMLLREGEKELLNFIRETIWKTL